jgi:hypothetical protein
MILFLAYVFTLLTGKELGFLGVYIPNIYLLKISF